MAFLNLKFLRKRTPVEELNRLLLMLPLLFYVYLVFLALKIILDNRYPTETIGWLLALILIPPVGVFIYFLGGQNWRKGKIVRFRPEEIFVEEAGGIIDQQKTFLENLPADFDNDVLKAILLNINSSGAFITSRNNCEFIFEGREFMDRLMEDLKKARRFIHMEFFIWRSDALGQAIGNILLEKAAQGVEVRIIFDGVGCFGAMSRTYKKKLKKGGVNFRYFLDPMFLFTGRFLNYRNHRKIVVIDRETAYTGGFNIGREYIDGGRRFAYWRDSGIRITGESVQFWQGIFLSDWENSGPSEGNYQKYLTPPGPPAGDFLPMQVVCSGPDSRFKSLELFLFNMITNANREVLIQSPYFIPSESLCLAMQTAAMGGVKVRIMMTGHPDKRMPFYAAQTYFEELLAAGAELYLYQRGFLHAKMYIADRTMASLGTCNLDIRSFSLHYEVNSVFYDEKTIDLLRRTFEADLAFCRKITPGDLRRRHLFVRLRNSVCRIVSPVL
jgi:cardiolipin synthase